MEISLLHLIVLLPLVTAVMIMVGAPARQLAQGSSVLNAVFGVLLFSLFDRDDAGFQFVASLNVLESPGINFALGVDGLGVVLVLLSVIVMLCAVWQVPKRIEGSEKLYIVSILLIGGGAIGAFATTDLFFFYAFHELALIPTFLMIGIFGHGPDRTSIAWKITIYLGVGSLVLLAGLLWLYQASGVESFDMLTLIEAGKNIDAEAQKWIFLLLIIGFGTLVSLFPFHSWAAPAYAAAPTPVSMLHAGVLKKFGLYGLLRLAVPMLPEGFAAWENLILVLLLGNVIFIGFVTISQRYLDRLLGYSSVMHMGYAFLGMMALNEVGYNGVVLMLFAHGLSVALLFALCGQLRERVPTLEIRELGGVAKAAPFLAVFFGLGAFASIGLPGFANFASEVMIFLAAFKDGLGEDGGITPLQITCIIAVWGVVISAVYMLRAYRNIFQGEREPQEGLLDVAMDQRWPLVLLVAGLVAAGIFPNLILNLLP
ncbi:MAG: NADH-quinone oxidoreductase subunit M [Verrucomicrobiota bacterium]